MAFKSRALPGTEIKCRVSVMASVRIQSDIVSISCMVGNTPDLWLKIRGLWVKPLQVVLCAES